MKAAAIIDRREGRIIREFVYMDCLYINSECRHIEVSLSQHHRLNALTIARDPASMMRGRGRGRCYQQHASKNGLQFGDEGNGFVQPNYSLPVHIRLLQVRRHRCRHSPERRHHRACCSLQTPQTYCLHPLSVHVGLRDVVCHGIVCLE